MSELKVYITPTPDGTGLADYYLKSEADKVIAEKDDEIAVLKVKLKVQTSNAEKAWKLKDSYHTNYAEAVKELYDKNKEIAEKDAENRRLKRALWLARANRADGEFIYWCARLAMESGFTKADIRGYSVNTKRKLRTIGEWIEVWKNVRSKCLKKAEEYK